jgi:hypothetical protein
MSKPKMIEPKFDIVIDLEKFRLGTAPLTRRQEVEMIIADAVMKGIGFIIPKKMSVIIWEQQRNELAIHICREVENAIMPLLLEETND